MVNLTRIYTRTGDDGTTGLGDFGRTSKDDPRLVAYADTDETNAALGVAMLHTADRPDVAEVLRRVQNELFDVGADLSLPLRSSYEYEPLRVAQEWIDDLEADCDRFNTDLPALRSFILPGGGALSAHLHVARTIARRAERAAWTAVAVHGQEKAPEGAEKGTGGVSPLPGRYLNRLSDLLFILARSAAGPDGDVLWQPGGGRQNAPKGRQSSAEKE
ncbi:cob(I)yrinic acid a,c-diamide adenosyltransferase [Kytococcus sp. Marseille-QA3725]